MTSVQPEASAGPGFARDHRERKIPWRDCGDDADGLLDDDDALVGLMLRDCVAVDALPFFGEPLDERGGVGDFAFCFGERLALLEGHELGEIFLICEQEIEPLAENYGAFFRGFLAPCGEGAIGGFDGLARFAGAEIGNIGDDFACGGIVYRKCFARGDPLAVDDMRLRGRERDL